MKVYPGMGLLFATVYLSCVFWEQELDAALWIMVDMLWLLLCGICLVLLAATVQQTWKQRNLRQYSKAALMLILLVAPFLVQRQFDSTRVQDFRFNLARPGYEARVQKMLHFPQVLQAEIATRDVRVDRTGDVTRIAFVQPGGILDNWTALVYDPSGEVENINAARSWQHWETSRFSSVRKLFEGDLTYAKPLGGGWYRCSFT